MLRIGLTGGICSGKSTVSHLFAELGVPVLDADQISRELVAPGKPALTQLVTLLGSSILTREGELDRHRLRDQIFRDSHLRLHIESILHPLIREQLLQQSADLDVPYVILAIPLLIETNWQSLVDRVLVVDCAPEIQLNRCMLRDYATAEQIEAIMASQATRADRLQHADDVIINDAELVHLRRQVISLHQRYLTMATLTQ